MQQLILDYLSTPAVITAIAAAAVYLVAKLFTAKPAWKQFEGLMITAIKIAEKAIPEGTSNKSLARADFAMQEFIRQYESTYAWAPSTALRQAVKANLPLVHNMLEETGTLKKAA